MGPPASSEFLDLACCVRPRPSHPWQDDHPDHQRWITDRRVSHSVLLGGTPSRRWGHIRKSADWSVTDEATSQIASVQLPHDQGPAAATSPISWRWLDGTACGAL